MQLTRLSAAAFIAAFALALSAPLSQAAEPNPPTVTDEGDGSYTGSHAQADNGGPSRKSTKKRDAGGESKTKEGAQKGSSSSKKGTKSKDKADSKRPKRDTSLDHCEADKSGFPITPIDCRGNRNVPKPPEAVKPDPLTRSEAEQQARRIVDHLQLPTPTPQIGPDPDANEWHMVAVGYPLWLWTEGPTNVTSDVTANGLTFHMQARYQSTTFDLGDHHTKTCTESTPYKKSTKPGTPSPTCGYTYTKPAPAKSGTGSYTITATSHWTIDWSVAGFSGSLPGTHTATKDLPVEELQAIVVK